MSNGTLVVNPDGSFTYLPNDGFSGIDSFNYTATDGNDLSAPTPVTITVGTPEPSEVTISQIVSFDGEQGGNGSFDTQQGGSDDDLEIGNGERKGLVFEDVPIAAGADILSAYLTLTSQRNQAGLAEIEIRLCGEADAITNGGSCVKTDPGFDTFDFVPFSVSQSWFNGETIETLDLSVLVQPLIDTQDPVDGGYDLSFSLASFSGIRRTEAEEFGDEVAVELNIVYGTAAVS